MSENSEQWTVGRLLTWTAEYLKRHGSDSPRLDAEVLLAHARGCRRIELYTAYHEVVSDAVRDAYRELVRRRAAGSPVAYLVGEREFYSLPFRVTPDVLIPRPETEFVVLALLDAARDLARGSVPLEIADVGTGSGILAVCAAKHLPGCHVTAIDSSAAALEVARGNMEKHGVDTAVELVLSDLFAAVPEARQFDVIVSNPPYVSEAEYARLSREVREHEPRQALVAGATGVETIARLVAQAVARLRPGGWLITEISPMIAGRVRELLAARGDFEPIRAVKDLSGHERVIVARRTRSPRATGTDPAGAPQ